MSDYKAKRIAQIQAEQAPAEIAKRLDVLDKLIGVGVHPPLCNCALKTRDPKPHLQDCPYKALRGVMDDLRKAFPTGERNGKK